MVASSSSKCLAPLLFPPPSHSRPYLKRQNCFFFFSCINASQGSLFEGVYKRRNNSDNSHGVAILYDSKVRPITWHPDPHCCINIDGILEMTEEGGEINYIGLVRRNGARVDSTCRCVRVRGRSKIKNALVGAKPTVLADEWPTRVRDTSTTRPLKHERRYRSAPFFDLVSIVSSQKLALQPCFIICYLCHKFRSTARVTCVGRACGCRSIPSSLLSGSRRLT